jgi:hypothetical protein
MKRGGGASGSWSSRHIPQQLAKADFAHYAVLLKPARLADLLEADGEARDRPLIDASTEHRAGMQRRPTSSWVRAALSLPRRCHRVDSVPIPGPPDPAHQCR